MVSYHHVQYQKKLMIQSWKNLVSDGLTDGQTERQTDESDFIGRCLTNIERPILNRVLYLNKKLYSFGLSNTHLCSFCKMEGENISPIISLHSYKRYLESSPALFHWLLAFFTMNTDICGFHNIGNDTFLIENYVLLLLRLHIYNTRKYGFYLLRIF